MEAFEVDMGSWQAQQTSSVSACSSPGKEEAFDCPSSGAAGGFAGEGPRVLAGDPVCEAHGIRLRSRCCVASLRWRMSVLKALESGVPEMWA